jgi:zinc finger protein
LTVESPQNAFVTRTHCPLCQKEILINWERDDIPYFGDVMYITACCDCSFRFTDTIILSQKEPVRYELIIEGPEDLYAKFVRSTSGTIKVPELGIMVEPGSISESYITNIEGLLDRILGVVVTATKWVAEEPEKYERGLQLQEMIQQAIDGKQKLTIIVEDPLGNSAIISEKAVYCKLTPEEARTLKTGMIVFDAESSEIEIDSYDEHMIGN